MRRELKILIHNGKQYIPDLKNVSLRPTFRGLPEISTAKVDEQALVAICPLGAISAGPISLDLGKCAFCGECAFAFPEKIKFTTNYKISSNKRAHLIIKEGATSTNLMDGSAIPKVVKKTFSKSLKLRQVSAGGDNSCEIELGAASNANFDMGRFGIEFTASPRHADGIVITGPITKNSANALQIAYNAIPDPKIVVLCGVDAISGGIFDNSNAIERNILNTLKVDLYIPGNPPHPLTFINALLDYTR